jgi:hypothetical protein
MQWINCGSAHNAATRLSCTVPCKEQARSRQRTPALILYSRRLVLGYDFGFVWPKRGWVRLAKMHPTIVVPAERSESRDPTPAGDHGSPLARGRPDRDSRASDRNVHHVKQPISFPWRVFAPGFCPLLRSPQSRGGRSAERRSGACEAPVGRAVTRHARRLRGALRGIGVRRFLPRERPI